MRGAARPDFDMPADMQARPRLRPYSPDPSLAQPGEPPTAPRWGTVGE
jgi:hypothetical protein